ncbi:TPA: JAB domain-containing protein, partial [Staphylococcus aureus]
SYLKCVAFFSFIRLNNSHISSKVTLITTARLVACGRILQIEVLDHIIITSDDFISIDEIGHMPDVSPEDIFDFM